MACLNHCFRSSLLLATYISVHVCSSLMVASADGPVPVSEASSRLQLPSGFAATLFAGEPDLVQPIAFTFDDRGRVWVVENHSYPGWQGDRHDRVLILEDTDGDGRFDHNKVFLDNGSNLSGIEWGFGGIWLCSTPHLVFVPDADGNDVPDGEPVVKLDGWDPTARHNVTNSLAWGPDGWLYGCNGILSKSRVGPPGIADSERIEMNCGVWRYHPTRGKFEVVAHGTTNPWGLDFDENGQIFITNCVIQHLWHVIPGARFQRMFGNDFHDHNFELMTSCADHLHWATDNWREARGGEVNDVYGGGHAHVGCMVYLGDNWPDTYRQQLFTCNLHGNRVNQEFLERHDSGYVARHAPDFMLANDPWFRGMTIKYGPDGGVFVSDWSDTGECHNYEVADRTNGRIFKITYGHPKTWKTDLGQRTDLELARLVVDRNEWLSRHARRLLHERHALKNPTPELVDVLNSQLQSATKPSEILRTLWTLHLLGGATDDLLTTQMASQHDVVRGWCIQLAMNRGTTSTEIRDRLIALADSDVSPWVHLALASAAQKLPSETRWQIAANLAQRGIEPDDSNLSLMIWYALEPSVMSDPPRSIRLITSSRIPSVAQFLARRMALPTDPIHLASLTELLSACDDAKRKSVLTGMYEALQGRRRVVMPANWPVVYASLSTSASASVRELCMLISVIFGDPQALSDAHRVAADSSHSPELRMRAIESLIHARVSGLSAFLHDRLTDPAVRVAALRGLAAVPDPLTPGIVLNLYSEMDGTARSEALDVLVSRPDYAQTLVAAIENRQMARSELTAFQVQQLSNLNDESIQSWVSQQWGAVRTTAADRALLIQQFRQKLTPAGLATANVARGRTVFDKNCATCHRMFDAGGRIGPDLTGSQRRNLDYVLTNVLDPSALVPGEFTVHLLELDDGRVISGLVKHEDAISLSVQTATELIIVPVVEIVGRRALETSMMPDGLITSLPDTDVRDLVAYLATEQQVEGASLSHETNRPQTEP
ncbi:MAG: c-type cytochrome [Planctomycetota bacterium]|nr:c-type cytochrome [Planctomycetota bacterium]